MRRFFLLLLLFSLSSGMVMLFPLLLRGIAPLERKIPYKPALLPVTATFISSLEEKREWEHIETLASQLGMAPHALHQVIIEKRDALQHSLPFSFPLHLYNVLFLPEAPKSLPYPYQIYQRLYLGESSFGLPLYLEVRVFEEGILIDEAIAWHLARLIGEIECLHQEECRKIFCVKGQLNPTYSDPPHGFVSLQQERGLFLDCFLQENRLYMGYFEAPLPDFVLALKRMEE